MPVSHSRFTYTNLETIRKHEQERVTAAGSLASATNNKGTTQA